MKEAAINFQVISACLEMLHWEEQKPFYAFKTFFSL